MEQSATCRSGRILQRYLKAFGGTTEPVRRDGYRPLSEATERVSPAIAIQSANHMLARPHENLSRFRCFRHSSDRIADVRRHRNLERNRHRA